MNKLKKISILIAIFILLSCSFCFFSCDKKESSNTIRLIEVTHSVFYAPMYVAIENKYFEEENLQIKLTNGGGADNCMTALLTKAQDIGLMGPEASIYVLEQGKKDLPVIFAQLTKKDGSFLMSRTKENNFSWLNLENKEIIGGRRGGVPALTVEYVLKKNNLINGQNTTINYDVEYDLIGPSFASGVGDYCTMFEPAATNMQNANQGFVVASVGAAAGEYPYTAFCALDSYITQNKTQVIKFIKALKKGMDFVNNHSAEEIANVVKNQFSGTPLDVVVSSIKAYKEIDAYSTTPIMKKEDFDRLQQIIIDGNIIEEKVEFSALVDNSFAEAALNE